MLYKDFVVQGNVKKARLYATALGVYEAEINGEPVDDTYFHPGWTNYRKRLQYQTCAVTLHSGKNRVALTLANGWYKGKLGFMPQPNHYGDTTAALAALCITYEDGHEESTACAFLVDNFCRADGGEHRCGRSVSTAPEAAYLLPGLGANGIVGGLQVVEPVLHQPLGGKGLEPAADYVSSP